MDEGKYQNIDYIRCPSHARWSRLCVVEAHALMSDEHIYEEGAQVGDQ